MDSRDRHPGGPSVSTHSNVSLAMRACLNSDVFAIFKSLVKQLQPPEMGLPVLKMVRATC